MQKMFGLLGLFLLAGCADRVYEVAYVSNPENSLDIFLRGSTALEPRAMTQTAATEYNLTWSKDGRQLYYTLYRKDGRQVNRIDVAEAVIEPLLLDSTILSLSDVSADQERLLISTTEDHPKGELYLYEPASGRKTRLTHNNFYEAGAKFAPGETTIVASIQTRVPDSTNHAGIAEIFAIDLLRNSLQRLTDMQGFNGLPAYSPDGRYIAFHHCREGQCDIYRMNSDGTELTNITRGEDDNRWPRWSPDGRWIAFTKTIGENSDIYLASKNGKVIKPFIATTYRDEIAEFRPRMSRR